MTRKSATTTTSEPARETVVAVRTETGEDALRGARVAAEQAREEREAAALAFDEIEAEDIDGADLHPDPDVAAFLANGRHEVRMKRAGDRVKAAGRAVERAEKRRNELAALATPDSARFAELAADRLRSVIGRASGGTYLGRVYVEPAAQSWKPDHAGNRKGAVRIVVEDSPLGARLVYAAMKEALAMFGESGAFSGDGNSYVYAWAGTLTDPVEREEARKRDGVRANLEYAARLGAVGDYPKSL